MSGKKQHIGRQVLVTILVTLIILLALVFCFARFLVPLFNIQEDQVYSVLTKLFPLLIGLVLIECGVMIAHRRDEDYADSVDLLPPNAYDKPLHQMPGDDPNHAVSNVPPATATAPGTFTQPDIPVEPGMQAMASMSAAAVMPQPQIIYKEVPVEVIKEVPVEVIKEVIREVPVPTAPGMKEVELDTFEDTFNAVLDRELQSSMDGDYDLSLVLLDISESPEKEAQTELLLEKTKEVAYCFQLDNGKIACILTFYQDDEARRYILQTLNENRDSLSGARILVGSASRNGRTMDMEELYHEAEADCSVSSEEENVSIDEVIPS